MSLPDEEETTGIQPGFDSKPKDNTKEEENKPSIDAESFDDAGDIEGLQLGLATAPKSENDDEPSE